MGINNHWFIGFAMLTVINIQQTIGLIPIDVGVFLHASWQVWQVGLGKVEAYPCGANRVGHALDEHNLADHTGRQHGQEEPAAAWFNSQVHPEGGDQYDDLNGQVDVRPGHRDGIGRT